VWRPGSGKFKHRGTGSVGVKNDQGRAHREKQKRKGGKECYWEGKIIKVNQRKKLRPLPSSKDTKTKEHRILKNKGERRLSQKEEKFVRDGENNFLGKKRETDRNLLRVGRNKWLGIPKRFKKCEHQIRSLLNGDGVLL